ncbi:MAG: hypothetical protein BIFFINMI_00837 [Phycisphaerae bacterium]|nr:hypothetical protein [Phycisphaerae bacterium]
MSGIDHATERALGLLQDCPTDRLGPAAAEAVALFAAGANVPAVDALADLLESRLGDPAAIGRVGDLLAEGPTPMAKLLAGRLLTLAARTDDAIAACTQALASLPGIEPDALAQRARLLAKAKRFEEAAADLQAALTAYPPYPFFVKSERLIERIIASGLWQPRRKIKLAVLASSTTALLAPLLRASCFRNGVQADVYEGPYGAIHQEILDPGSGLYRFAPDAVLILVNSRDLALPPSGGMQQAADFCGQLRARWSQLRDRLPCHVIQVGFDCPPAGAWGALEEMIPDGRRRVLAEANRLLLADLPPYVSFIDPGEVALQFAGPFHNAVEWHTARQYPASAALPLLADHVAAHCQAVLGLTAKVLVMDLDNTMWEGIIGEDGLGGIKIGPPSPQGEGRLELQRYAKELQGRGILLAVCSKNSLANAESPFRSHDSMLLKLEDFVAFAANWQDKASNLRAMAEELSLGLDSFVFLDDSPIERAWVRRELPQVIVPECGPAPWDMLAALRRGMYFESLALTKEDFERHRSYKANADRRRTEQAAGSLEDFLRGLELTARHGPVDEAALARVAQLTNKTSQFNLTTRRYTEEQVRAMAESPDWWCRWFRLTDKFGDYGLIGVIFARTGETWEIDTWLMSCRALGRQLEQFMCRVLADAARTGGASAIRGQYIPTARNGLVKDHYAELGFKSESEEGRFLLDLSAASIPTCDFISTSEPAPNRI